MEFFMSTDKKDFGKNLAYAAFDSIPTPNSDAKEDNNLGNLPSVSK